MHLGSLDPRREVAGGEKSPRGLLPVPVGWGKHHEVGRGLALSALLVVGLRPRCLKSCKGLCMSLGGKDPLLEATPSREVKGVAQYEPFKKGPM